MVSQNSAFGQTIINNNNNRTQLWVDKENNAKIIFTYEPESPVIGNPTELLFNVQNNLQTGEQLKNLSARIIITNGQKIFKIANTTSSNGDFSINYTFPDSGSYQVISRLDSKDLAALASFKLLVPPQVLSSGFKSFSELMLFYVIPITSVAGVIAVYLTYKKEKDQQ